jgi:hypothetical protein
MRRDRRPLGKSLPLPIAPMIMVITAIAIEQQPEP